MEEPIDYTEGNKIIADFMGEKSEIMYNITEWITDSAHTSWWRYQDIINEPDITNYSDNEEDWHCCINEKKTQSKEYHTDWIVLINVINKIEKIEINNMKIEFYSRENLDGWYGGFKSIIPTDFNGNHDYYGEEINGCSTRLSAAWWACVNFINYYNKLD